MKSKMKLKKEVKLIIIGIGCLITIFIVLSLCKNSSIVSNKKLKGEKLTSGLYKYDTKEKESLQMNIINNNIYYLTNNERTFKLHEIDIYTNETKEVGTINDSISKKIDSFKENVIFNIKDL